MASFFNAERLQASWRFFILWMAMSLLGLGIGGAIEFFLFKQINGNIAVLLASIAQGWTLNRHISIYIPWAASTVIAWWLAALIVGGIVGMIPNLNWMISLAIVALVAGILGGILQYFFLKEWLPVGIWWVAIAAFGWISFAIISGIALTIILSRDVVPMKGRKFSMTEPVEA